MRAVIISSSYSYLERIKLLEEAYQKQGYDTVVILTDFIHSSKTTLTEKQEGYEYIKTKPYYKNISVARLYSHLAFARDAFRKVREMEVDLLHVLIPANALAMEADRYKKENPRVTLYLDFIDLWPETMPIRRFKRTFPFQIWKQLRDGHVSRANTIYCECNLYKQVLGVEQDERYKVLYWAKASECPESKPLLSDSQIHLCYLGSVNNIIDMDKIVEICKNIEDYQPVTLHLIANGEKKEEFLQFLREHEVRVRDHGSIYDDKIKQQIFDQCHFGLNIMKPTVCVGLTMKSLDYFKAQLPIINSIAGDTQELVLKHRIGFHISDNYAEKIKDLTVEDHLQMRLRVKELFELTFSKTAFFAQLEEGKKHGNS